MVNPVTTDPKATGRLGGLKNGERQRAKTHCPHGHEYTPENTVLGSKGERQCRACRKESRKRYKDSHKRKTT